MCLKICGTKPGAVCDGENSKTHDITRSYKNVYKIFDPEEKYCKIKESIQIYYFVQANFSDIHLFTLEWNLSFD